MHPNFHVLTGVLKSDLLETKRHLDMLRVGRLEEPRPNKMAEKKKEQRKHLREALRNGMELDSYLIAMGATNLKLDGKTRQRFRQARGLSNNRRILDAAMDNVVLMLYFKFYSFLFIDVIGWLILS